MSTASYEMSLPAIRLIDSIESITIRKTPKRAYWTIKIGGERIRVTSTQLYEQRAFRIEYMKTFIVLLPRFRRDEWHLIIAAMSEKITEVSNLDR